MAGSGGALGALGSSKNVPAETIGDATRTVENFVGTCSSMSSNAVYVATGIAQMNSRAAFKSLGLYARA